MILLVFHYSFFYYSTVIPLFMKPLGKGLAAQWMFYARISPITIYEIEVVSQPYIYAAKMDTMNPVESF